jgi:uncharacterized iron-regulated membrane protein
MKLRSLIFWPHLIAGVVAGVVILLMCVTGVLLTYERQLIAWADSGFRSVSPGTATTPLSMDALPERLHQTEPDLKPTLLTVRADRESAVAVGAGARTVYVDRHSGALVGEASSGGIRAFMADVRAWHRWLSVEGEGRPMARAITGWSNFIFLFIVMSGIYLWLPRRWSWRQVRNVVFFNGATRGKARDFNWHNVIGSWCAIPLFVVVLSALPISFGWFNTFIYRVVGETPPAGPARGGEGRNAANTSTRGTADALSAPGRRSLGSLWARAEAAVPDWQSISFRVSASATTPAVFTIDRGDGGQPHLRSTLTLDQNTAAIVRHETFSDLSLGRRIRNTMRFAHTGEVFGIPGQTVAGIVSAGGAVLVWTGLALAWRRFRSWLSRRASRSDDSRVPNAA